MSDTPLSFTVKQIGKSLLYFNPEKKTETQRTIELCVSVFLCLRASVAGHVTPLREPCNKIKKKKSALIG